MELPSVTAVSCVYPGSSGGNLGRLMSEFRISMKTKHNTGWGPCAESLCQKREKPSFSQWDKINMLN